MSEDHRYRLPRERVLRGRDVFRDLFEHGRSLRAGDVLLKYRRIERPGAGDALAAFVVPRKHGKAVRRNRTRRLMREAWRLIRPDVARRLPDGVELHLALVWIGPPYNQSAPQFDRIRRDLERGLKRIAPPFSGEHASQPQS